MDPIREALRRSAADVARRKIEAEVRRDLAAREALRQRPMPTEIRGAPEGLTPATDEEQRVILANHAMVANAKRLAVEHGGVNPMEVAALGMPTRSDRREVIVPSMPRVTNERGEPVASAIDGDLHDPLAEALAAQAAADQPARLDPSRGLVVVDPERAMEAEALADTREISNAPRPQRSSGRGMI